MCRPTTTTTEATPSSTCINPAIKEETMESTTKPDRQDATEAAHETAHATTHATPDYWQAPVPAAEAPLHDFGDPNLHAEHPDHHKAFQDHDFGMRA